MYCLCSFREELLQRSAVNYVECIVGQGASLNQYIGFLDCTKVFIQHRGGPCSNQNACYGGHKRAHCMDHVTTTISDGLVLYMYGLEEGRRHKMTFYRKRNLGEILQAVLVIGGEQFYMYEDSGVVT